MTTFLLLPSSGYSIWGTENYDDIFHISAAPCPPIHPPRNGQFDKCQNKPVFGEICTFRCDKDFKLTSGRSRACQRHDTTGVTYWTEMEPTCKRKID